MNAQDIGRFALATIIKSGIKTSGMEALLTRHLNLDSLANDLASLAISQPEKTQALAEAFKELYSTPEGKTFIENIKSNYQKSRSW